MLTHSDGSKAFSGLMPKGGKLPTMSDAPRPPKDGGKLEGDEGEKMSSMHEHGDGSFHTMKDGAREEHPDMGHALMAMAAHHKPEGKHVHAHHDGMSAHSHGISGGEHDGPNEHESGEEAGQHMGNYLSDEGGAAQDEPAEAQDHEGLSGFSG